MTTTLNQNSLLLHSAPKTSFDNPVLENLPHSPAAIEFDWKNKWLRGEEYAYILKNIDLYCQTFRMIKLPPKTHPSSIYTEPQDGMMYFVEGDSVGSDFGFPRVDIKKRFRWKKMNFTTDLPKKRPCVTYIVASAVKCGKFFPNSKEEGPSFRMHAVILNKSGLQTQKYKNKEAPNGAFNYAEDLNSIISTTCSSIADAELEKHDSRPEVKKEKPEFRPEVKKNSEKNYVLCHLRKIDQNYKTAKASGKRENPYDDEDEDDSELDEVQGFSRKFICGEDNFDSQSRTIRTPIRDEPSHQNPSDSNNAFLFQKLAKSGKKSQGKIQASTEKQGPVSSVFSDKKGSSNLQNFIPFKMFSNNSTYTSSKTLPTQSVTQQTTATTEEFLSRIKKDDGNNIDYLSLLNQLVSHKKT